MKKYTKKEKKFICDKQSLLIITLPLKCSEDKRFDSIQRKYENIHIVYSKIAKRSFFHHFVSYDKLTIKEIFGFNKDISMSAASVFNEINVLMKEY